MSSSLDPQTAADLPLIPRDAEGPVFRAPWEAQAFAIVFGLHQRGKFTWAEWTQTLGAQIAHAKEHGDLDLGDAYYQHWLAALETLLMRKGLTDPDECHARESALRSAATAAHVYEARREPVKIG